jgi:regulator of sigma E protease
MTILLAILALGMLIVVHEAGHYFVARWCGMRVERFSIGFGPGIIKWRNKQGTLFQIAPIPFGGFVQIVGMNPHEEYDEKDPSVYPNRPTILRVLTIFAGPFTNIVFSSVLIFIVAVGAGVPKPTGRTVIHEVQKDSPAAAALKEGDIITSVDGAVKDPVQFRDHILASGGKPVSITFLRAGQEQTVSITPRLTEDVYRVGVGPAEEMERSSAGLGESAAYSVRWPYVVTKQILGGLWHAVKNKGEGATLVGPVKMTKHIREQIDSGWIRTLEFLALLNLYLGIFNLLPLPALDGGRLAFLGYELATRRRPNPKVETAVHMAGMLVLLVLLFFVTYREIGELITGSGS